jgi:hypothetical protein
MERKDLSHESTKEFCHLLSGAAVAVTRSQLLKSRFLVHNLLSVALNKKAIKNTVRFLVSLKNFPSTG